MVDTSQVCGGAQDPGFIVGSGRWGENPRSPKAQLGLTDRRQVRPGSPDCNFVVFFCFLFFFPQVCDLEPVSLFCFCFPSQGLLCSSGYPGTSSVDLAVFELLENYLPLPSKCWD